MHLHPVLGILDAKDEFKCDLYMCSITCGSEIISHILLDSSACKPNTFAFQKTCNYKPRYTESSQILDLEITIGFGMVHMQGNAMDPAESDADPMPTMLPLNSRAAYQRWAGSLFRS